jgi:hypothetical protein
MDSLHGPRTRRRPGRRVVRRKVPRGRGNGAFVPGGAGVRRRNNLRPVHPRRRHRGRRATRSGEEPRMHDALRTLPPRPRNRASVRPRGSHRTVARRRPARRVASRERRESFGLSAFGIAKREDPFAGGRGSLSPAGTWQLPALPRKCAGIVSLDADGIVCWHNFEVEGTQSREPGVRRRDAKEGRRHAPICVERTQRVSGEAFVILHKRPNTGKKPASPERGGMTRARSPVEETIRKRVEEHPDEI